MVRYVARPRFGSGETIIISLGPGLLNAMNYDAAEMVGIPRTYRFPGGKKGLLGESTRTLNLIHDRRALRPICGYV